MPSRNEQIKIIPALLDYLYRSIGFTIGQLLGTFILAEFKIKQFLQKK